MFNRLMMTLRSNVGDLVSRAEDPEKMLNQVILDMQYQLVEAKKQVAVVIADEKRLHRQAEAAQKDAEGWERKAMLAIRAGDDNLARAALHRKAEHDEVAGMFNEQWQAQRRSAEQLRFALQGLAAKIDEAHRERRVLIARQRRAEAQRMIAHTLSNLNVSAPLGIFERMEARVAQVEAEAEAIADMDGHYEPSLEAQFRALESRSTVDDELDRLKRRMIDSGDLRPRRALGPASN
jgi:phage shock protein A